MILNARANAQQFNSRDQYLPTDPAHKNVARTWVARNVSQNALQMPFENTKNGNLAHFRIFSITKVTLGKIE